MDSAKSMRGLRVLSLRVELCLQARIVHEEMQVHATIDFARTS